MNKVYLAGPMSNIPHFNFPAFHEGEAKLREMGFNEIFSPAKHDIERAGYDFSPNCPTGSHTELKGIPQINYRDCMRADLNWIIDNATHIALLPGWEKSKGAVTEHALAKCLGLEIIILDLDSKLDNVVRPCDSGE